MESCQFSFGGGGEGVALLSFILTAVFKELQEIPDVDQCNTSLTK